MELDASQIKKLVQVYVQELQRCSSSQNSKTFTSSKLSDSLDLQIQHLKPLYQNKKRRRSSKHKLQSINDQTFGGTQSQKESLSKKHEVKVKVQNPSQEPNLHEFNISKNKSLSDLASDHQKMSFTIKNQSLAKRSDVGSTFSSV